MSHEDRSRAVWRVENEALAIETMSGAEVETGRVLFPGRCLGTARNPWFVVCHCGGWDEMGAFRAEEAEEDIGMNCSRTERLRR